MAERKLIIDGYSNAVPISGRCSECQRTFRALDVSETPEAARQELQQQFKEHACDSNTTGGTSNAQASNRTNR